MNILSKMADGRIDSQNWFVETTIGEYLGFAKRIIDNNDMQRKRVKSSGSVYALLKEDIKKGCVIPPLVLAVANYDGKDNGDDLLAYIMANTSDVMILDGLQRTYTMLDANNDLKSAPNHNEYLGFTLRLELYMSINKFGILYRMLTLNTGQTPMSTRHQIEILYRGMIDNDIDGIRLVTESSGGRKTNPGTFRFKDAVEGFSSYMSRDELPLDRQDILETVKMLENLSQEDTKKDVFKEFITSYSMMIRKLDALYGNDEITEAEKQEFKLSGEPFAKSALKAFNTSQALTGYGAALGRMKDLNVFATFEYLESTFDKITSGGTDNREWFSLLMVRFEDIKEFSKKIGNSQRMYFQYFFRELFNPETDSYLNLAKAVNNGYQKYRTQI